MIDLKEYLRRNNRIFGVGEPGAQEGKVLPRRNQLLSEAKDSLRRHLQQQLLTALKKFNEEGTPADPLKIS